MPRKKQYEIATLAHLAHTLLATGACCSNLISTDMARFFTI